MEYYVEHEKHHYDHTHNAIEFTVVDRLDIFFLVFYSWKKLSYQPKHEWFSKLWICIHTDTLYCF
jgi:hypothetical protein